MSRIGKLPIEIPSGITVQWDGEILKMSNGKEESKIRPHTAMEITMTEKEMRVSPKKENPESNKLHGLTRSLIANAVQGLKTPFEKKLEIRGVGYRAQMEGEKLTLSLGFSHPIVYNPPVGIHIEIDKEKKNILTISGANKQLVGQVAAEIRNFRKPEPYKGKGIRYLGENVPKKAGKTAATAKE